MFWSKEDLCDHRELCIILASCSFSYKPRIQEAYGREMEYLLTVKGLEVQVSSNLKSAAHPEVYDALDVKEEKTYYCPVASGSEEPV
mmetsp:Transcript_29006/g.27911  ORF Transcript_29006/g.27911 Transcript_29006/m.27911 type:complete len:87 (+) Transcript_29006:384-644(+)